MASPNLANSPAFLVFPTGSSEFAWRIVALATGRTISRFKDLGNAVRKAEVLNLRAMFPVLPEAQYGQVSRWVKSGVRGSCQNWFAASDSAIGEQCDNTASISDLDTGMHLCVSCWKESL